MFVSVDGRLLATVALSYLKAAGIESGVAFLAGPFEECNPLPPRFTLQLRHERNILNFSDRKQELP